MKINGKLPEGQDVYLRTQKVQRQEAQEKDAAGVKTDTKDTINLSGRSRELRGIKEGIEKLPDVRAEKVDKLKEAVANGTYTIDPVKIAKKMLEEI